MGIKSKEKFRKYCPRKTLDDPFRHGGKRSVSRIERSAGLVEISYKAPFLDILENVKYGRSSTARRERLTEIADDVEIDAENCDRNNKLASIANSARAAASSARSSRSFRYYVDQIIGKFESLGDFEIDCAVDESSPLATYRRCGGRSYCRRGTRCVGNRYCVAAG